MKNHLDFSSIFQFFWDKIETQFDCKIKILQIDNAREYLSS